MQRTVDILEGRGYRVAFSPNFDARYGYLAGGDAARAADLQWALAADEHAAIFSIQGGYGCARLHPHLDWRALRRARPKVVCGYSDLTALHLMIARELGWVTFHGPNAAGVADRNAFSTGALWRALRPLPLGDVPVDPAHDGIVWRITGGVAEGPLAGGNQHVLSRAIGTPFAPSLSGAIVVLEEVESEPYRLEADLSTCSRPEGWPRPGASSTPPTRYGVARCIRRSRTARAGRRSSPSGWHRWACR